MKEMKIFVIEEEQSIRLLIEEVFGDRCYTLASLDDLSFRLHEFGPSLVLLGASLFFQDPKRALAELKISSDIPCALLGFKEEGEQARTLGWDRPIMVKPLKVATLEQDFTQFFTKI